MPRPLLPATSDCALHSVAQTRAIETAALARRAALGGDTLMQRAGLALARLALAIAPHARRAWIAAGPGNNGGDGLDAAVHLQRAGWRVDVTLLEAADGAAATRGDDAVAGTAASDARAARQRAQAAGVTIHAGAAVPPDLAGLDTDDLALDALLGIGASRAPQGALADSVRALNTLRCPVLAVDVPSGLAADTGRPFGGACVVAQHTLTFLTAKPGLFTAAGRDHAGRIWLDTLGVDPALLDGTPRAWLRALAARLPPAARRHAQHKGSFGDVLIVGGSPGMAGAALLAGRAAHGAGAGRVFVELLAAGASAPTVDVLHPELMFRPDASLQPAMLAACTVVCGCGGGDAVRAVLPRLLSRAARLVLDADALNAIAADPTLAALLRARPAASTVLTPHPLEAARLLGCATAEVQADRLHAAQELAERHRALVVLKGSGSVIAAPGAVPGINASGSAALASPGTGDVLAGWLGGSWPADAAAPLAEIVQRAVAEHGAVADAVPGTAPIGALRAGDLIERLHALRGGR